MRSAFGIFKRGSKQKDGKWSWFLSWYKGVPERYNCELSCACATGGIYIHNSNNEIIRNNTIYNCGPEDGEIVWASGGISVDANAAEFSNSIYNNIATNNSIFALASYQNCLNYYADENGSNGEIGNFGVLDSNIYLKVNGSTNLIKSQHFILKNIFLI